MPSEVLNEKKSTNLQRWWVAFIMAIIPVLLVVALRDHPTYISSTNILNLPKINEVFLSRDSIHMNERVELPYSVNGFPGETLNFHIVLTYMPAESSVFWVIPDDCVDNLVVNATKIELPEAAVEHRCDWQQGFRIDLQPYLHEGKNDIDFAIYNKKGKTGLTFEPILK